MSDWGISLGAGEFIAGIGESAGGVLSGIGEIAGAGLKTLSGGCLALWVFIGPGCVELNSSEAEWIEEIKRREEIKKRDEIYKLLMLGVVKVSANIFEGELEKQVKILLDEIVEKGIHNVYSVGIERIKRAITEGLVTERMDNNLVEISRQNVHKTVIGGEINPKPIDYPQTPQSIKDHKPIDVWPKGKELPQSGKDVIILGEESLDSIGKDVIVLGEKEPQPIQTGTIYGGTKSNPSEKGKAQQQKSKEKTQSSENQGQATKQKDVINKKQEDKTLEQTFKKGLEALERVRVKVKADRKAKLKEERNAYGAKTAMFASGRNPDIFGIASSSNWVENPTILIEGEEVFFEKPDDMSYEQYYNYHLSDEYLESLPESFFECLGSNKDSVRVEMQNLRLRIELVKKLASEEGEEGLRNNMGNLSFEPDWNVENCAEIWSARIAVMKGAKFDDLVFVCVHTSNGAYAPPCKNCEITFEVVINVGEVVAEKKKKKTK